MSNQRRMLEKFVVEAFRDGKLSSFEVCEMLSFESWWDAIGFLSERGVYPGYDLRGFASG